MIELNSRMRFETDRGTGLFIREAVKMYAWKIEKITILECPLSFGNIWNEGGSSIAAGLAPLLL